MNQLVAPLEVRHHIDPMAKAQQSYEPVSRHGWGVIGCLVDFKNVWTNNLQAIKLYWNFCYTNSCCFCNKKCYLHCEKSLFVLASRQKIPVLRTENPAVDTRTICLLPIEFFKIPHTRKATAEKNHRYGRKIPVFWSLGGDFLHSHAWKVKAGKSQQAITDTAGKSQQAITDTARKSHAQ